MGSGLYLRSEDGSLIRLDERELREVADLQPLLAATPALLGGDRDDGPAGWMLVQRELGISSSEDEGNRWSVDHLFLDSRGTPTLVEVKHSTNTEIRRTVVGQLLEYGANFASYWTADDIKAAFAQRCAASGESPDDILSEVLGVDDVDQYWRAVDQNIDARNIRLVFAADSIPPELRRIIEFLNEEMVRIEVLGLEVKAHESESGALVTSRIIGATEAAKESKRGSTRPSGRTWDEDTYLEKLRADRGNAEAKVVADLIVWGNGDKRLSVEYGTGIQEVSVKIGIDAPDAYAFPFQIFTKGAVEVGFQWMLGRPYPPFHRQSKREELRLRLEQIPGVVIPAAKIEGRPSFDLSLLLDANALGAFRETFDWVFGEARRSGLGKGQLNVARQERDEERAGLADPAWWPK